MSYEAELAGRYAGAHERLMRPSIKPTPKRQPVALLSPPAVKRDPLFDKWPDHKPPVTYLTILREVATKYNTTVSAITGASRTRSIMPARRESIARMFLELGMSLPKIGKRMNRDHTTILHALRRAAEVFPELAGHIEAKRAMQESQRQFMREEAIRYHRLGLSRNEIARLTGFGTHLVSTIIQSIGEDAR